jgi:superfamily II DNA or RNA helicase
MSTVTTWLEQFFKVVWNLVPRAFQVEAFRAATTGNPPRWSVWNITPAAGKTKIGVAVAKWRLETGKNRRIVIVAPTIEVRDSWKDEFHLAGVNIMTEFDKNVKLDPAFHGVAVTYAAVCSNPKWFKDYTMGGAYIIFDEIHHLEDQKGWGKTALFAFDYPGNETLGLTGTLWRPIDRESMSFVTYDPQGVIIADFSYGYDKALVDDIVRGVSFPTWDTMNETAYLRDGQLHEGSFAADASREQWNDTLRCAIDPDFNFLKQMVEAAHECLMGPQLRGGGDPMAGGIFFGESISQLERVQQNVFKPLGIKSIVVHSGPDCADPKGEIRRFRNDSTLEWVLCVRMITEGVSITRLRVGVHGSCVTSELSFRQMLGRILRRLGVDDGEAFYFMPRHPDLVRYAETIEVEVGRVRNLTSKTSNGGGGGGDGGDGGGGPSTFVGLTAEGQASVHIVGSETIDPAEVRRGEETLREAGLVGRVSGAVAAILMRHVEHPTSRPAVPSTPLAAPGASLLVRKPLEDEKREWSKKVTKLQKRAARFTCVASDPAFDLARDSSRDEFKKEIRRIGNEVLAPLDGVYNNQRQLCTLDQLKKRYECLVAYLQRIMNEESKRRSFD